METKIVDIVESTTLDERGNLVKVMVVSYKVGDLGPYTIEIPKVQFTHAKAKELVEKEAEEIRKMFEIG